jgi:hypothetical protein
MFEVCSTIVWDQWMQTGWNDLTLPFGAISCSYDTEDVLISIDGMYDWVFWYNPATKLWDWYKYSDKTGLLTQLYAGREYWVYMNTAGRFFTDTEGPEVEIVSPEDGDVEIGSAPDYIDIYAFDIETSVTDVYTRIYNETSGYYWNGGSWQGTETWLDCYHDYDDYWQYDASGIPWAVGHTYEITAYAIDVPGCPSDYDTVTITIIEGD